MMKAIEMIGAVDEQHRLKAEVPDGLPPGPVRVLVLPPGEDPADLAWMRAVASEWSDVLVDPREDLYTLEDGHPLDDNR